MALPPIDVASDGENLSIALCLISLPLVPASSTFHPEASEHVDRTLH
ncbi:hypothetical protein ACNKHT_22010 [Shigella flexneri]